MEASLEVLFERFRSTGDPDALAAVYDRVAVRLLRLGIHLTHDQAQAEDLLQATFVAAIESARAFERGRQLLPWLMGILANQARKARARVQREEPDRPQHEPAVIDPHHEAELEELSRALDHAIEQVPEVHRPVLVLKLKHGLTPAEIAHALERAPGTVRVQLHRGLEQLRALLPAGFALSALLVITPTRGLAAVREAVLAGVPAHTVPVVAAVGIGGFLLMNKLLVSAAVVLVTGILGYVVWPQSTALGVAAEGGVAGSVAAASRASAESVPASASQASGPTQRVAMDTPLRDPAARGAAITGRCVAEESGLPLTAGEVRLQWTRGRDGAEPPGPNPHPVALDADGRFRVPIDATPTGSRLLLRIAPQGRVDRMDFLVAPAAGSTRDLGDLRFEVGSAVTGTVREENGAPVPEVRLEVLYAPPRLFDTVDDHSGFATTDEHGRFRLRERLPAGSHPFKLPEDCTPVGRPRLLVPEGGADMTVEITVKRAPIAGKVTGVVLDDVGRPLAGARVTATRCDVLMPAPIAQARTGADGAFDLVFRGGGLDRVRVEARSSDLQDPEPQREARLGSHLTIQMLHVAGLEITVREAATGTPVEDYAILLTPKTARRVTRAGPRWEGRHAAGVLVVTGEEPGEYLLQVLPKDREHLRPSRNVPVAIQAGAPTRAAVDLQAPVVLRVVVGLASGASVPGSRVQLIRVGLGPHQVDQMEEIGREGMVFSSTALGPVEPTVVLDEGTTDARGEVGLGAGPDESNLVVRALGPGHVPAVQRGVVATRDGAPLRMVVSRGAALSARIAPVAVLAALDYVKGQREALLASQNKRASFYEGKRPGVALRRIGQANPDCWLPNGNSVFPADASGMVHADGLAPGSYEVFLRWWDARLRNVQSKAPLATLTLIEDQKASIDLDVASLLPGSFAACVLLDGQPLGSCELQILNANQEPITDAEGRITVAALDPGRYRVRVRTGDGKPRPAAGIVSDEEVEIEPGKAVSGFVFHLRTRTVRLQILQADGTTAANLKLALIGGPSRLVTTGADGTVLVTEVPHGRFEVRRVPPEAEDKIQATPYGVMGEIGLLPSLGTVEVPIAETEVRATLRLP